MTAAEAAAIKVENGVVKFYFATGSAEVAPNAREALADVIKAVQSGNTVLVSGYHDATGDAAKNAELAKQRAVAVGDVPGGRRRARGQDRTREARADPGRRPRGRGAARRGESEVLRLAPG